MKNFLHLALILFLSTTCKAQLTKEQYKLAAEVLYRKTSFLDQLKIKQETFAELAYLKRTHQLDSFNLQTKSYIANLNDYYYKDFYLYSKLLNENAIITEDCIQEAKLLPIKKLLFYCIYPQSVKLPNDIVEQLEEQATVDEFLGPYYALNNIYFLKKYNSHNLSAQQKSKLEKTEQFFSNLLFNKYVKDKEEWNYHKFLSLKVLRMNKYQPAENINIEPLAYFILKDISTPLALGETDLKDSKLMNSVGYYQTLEMEANALLWIFLLEVDKK